MAILAVAIVALFTYMILEPFWIKTTYISIKSKRIPNSFKGYRLAFVSDIHYEPSFAARLKRTVKRLKRLSPDLLIMGGDYVTYGKKNVSDFFSTIKDIAPPDGVYCALGNHDYRTGISLLKETITNSKYHLLENESYWLKRSGDRILIAGVGDWWRGSQLTEQVLSDATEDEFIIMVSHNGDYFIENPIKNVDLALSGHTHGGQLTFFGLVAPLIKVRHKRYRYGLFPWCRGMLYVTSGLGTTFPRIRFFCRPEIVIFTLLPL
jgi:uncharacterized protein